MDNPSSNPGQTVLKRRKTLSLITTTCSITSCVSWAYRRSVVTSSCLLLRLVSVGPTDGLLLRQAVCCYVSCQLGLQTVCCYVKLSVVTSRVSWAYRRSVVTSRVSWAYRRSVVTSSCLLLRQAVCCYVKLSVVTSSCLL
jgi:hypothetical protein